MEGGLVSPSVEGTPQGGPLSPLLSNLVLDELDRELERRGHGFARYADDCNIYVGSERAGQRVMESITNFIETELKLKVNNEKSAVAKPQERKFLGFSFTGGAKPKRRIAPKAKQRFRKKVREITRRKKGDSMKQRVEELRQYLRGWRGYFGFCETPTVLKELDSWVRRRLRSCYWIQWKTRRRRFDGLVGLGVSRELAANTAGSNRGPWYLSKSVALRQALPNAYFDSIGLPRLAVSR
jgi:RNA-directed DNA polymerase